jgi:crossover junction endodeoxyribonuclease RuvC
MTNKHIRIVGLDLSLVGSGVIVLDDGDIVVQKLIKSKPVGPKPIDELKRIRKIVEEIEMIISEEIPTVAVIEGLAFMARNTTALIQLSSLNYMTRAMLADYHVPFVIVAPTSLKKFITGSGASKKDVMLMEIYKQYDVTIMDDNEADAFALAQVGLALSGKHIKPLNQKQEEVIELLKKQL